MSIKFSFAILINTSFWGLNAGSPLGDPAGTENFFENIFDAVGNLLGRTGFVSVDAYNFVCSSGTLEQAIND